MIVKEYRCLDCDSHFESHSPDPVCPECSASEPQREFLTAPGLKSPRTSRKDEIVKDLATTYQLPDLSNKHGLAVKQPRSGADAPQFAGPEAVQSMRIPNGYRDQFSPLHSMMKHPNTLPRTRAK